MSDTNTKTLEQKRKEFDLEMADVIWLRIKGVKVPDTYSENDRLGILARYWHRAIEKEDYYFDNDSK